MPRRAAARARQGDFGLRDLSSLSFRQQAVERRAAGVQQTAECSQSQISAMKVARTKISACAAALAVLVTCSTTPAQERAATPATAVISTLPGAVIVTKMDTNLRIGPDSRHGVIAVLRRGETVGTSGAWSRVRRANATSDIGWVSSDQLQRSQVGSAPRLAHGPAVAPVPAA